MESKFLLIATYDVTRPRCAGSWRAAAGVCTCPRPHMGSTLLFHTHTDTGRDGQSRGLAAQGGRCPRWSQAVWTRFPHKIGDRAGNTKIGFV